MNIKKLLLAFLILIVFVAFFYLYEIRGKRQKQRIEKAERILYDFHGKEIVGLTLYCQGETIELSKQNGLWTILEPILYPASPQIVEQIITSLNKVRILEFIEEAEEYSQYHLDPPMVKVILKTEDHFKWPALSLGNEIPLKDGYFAKQEGKESVLVISLEIVPLMKANLFQLRDKELLPFSKWDISELGIQSGPMEMTFQKAPQGWDIVQPVKLPANDDMVSQILSMLETSSIEKFIEEEPSDLGAYKLSPPERIVFFRRSAKEDWCYLLLGKAEEGYLYAKRSDRNPVFLIKDSILSIIKSPEDFRDMRISRRNRYSVKRFNIKVDGNICEAERSTNGEWLSIKPGRKILKEGDVYELLAFVLEITATGFSDLDQLKEKERESMAPLIIAKISGDQFKDEIVFLQDSQGRIYAKNSAIQSSFYRISQQDLEKLRQALLKCIGP